MPAERVLGEAKGAQAVGCSGGGLDRGGTGETLTGKPKSYGSTNDRLISAVNFSAEGGGRAERVYGRGVDDIFEQPAENTTLDARSASRFRFEPVSRAG